MRLDHLLSRERSEGEEPEHDPRSRVERVKRFSELTRKAPEGRPARRRAEEKDASDESTVLEVFLHCIALKVCQTMAKLQAFCPGKERRRPHLENCTGRDKTKTANDLFQPVLGDRLFAKNWHWFVFPKGSMSIDQANKSAGWMPRH